MSAHTPGPWEARVSFAQGESLAVVVRSREPSEAWLKQAQADAHLISAAPEMLEALYVARDQIREFLPTALGEALTIIEAAIARAEGKP